MFKVVTLTCGDNQYSVVFPVSGEDEEVEVETNYYEHSCPIDVGGDSFGETNRLQRD